MLTLSYAEALADSTYCEAGHAHGKKLTRTMGVKPNEPRPLKDILPYCTVAESLWCLRAVRASQRAEADRLAWAFTHDTLTRLAPLWRGDSDIMLKTYLMQKITEDASGQRSRRATLEERYQRKWESPESTADGFAYKAALAAVSNDSPSQIAINVSDYTIKYRAFSSYEIVEENAQRATLERIFNG